MQHGSNQMYKSGQTTLLCAYQCGTLSCETLQRLLNASQKLASHMILSKISISLHVAVHTSDIGKYDADCRYFVLVALLTSIT